MSEQSPAPDGPPDPPAHLHEGPDGGDAAAPAPGIPEEAPVQPDPKSTARGAEADAGLGELVEHWLTWSETASALGVPVSRVRQMIKDHELAAAVPAKGAGQQVPALLLDAPEVVKGVPGLLTLMHDNGFDDVEILTWIFTPDDTLPGRPIDALRENRGREVKRRAQVMMAF